MQHDESYLAAVSVGSPQRLDGPVYLAEYDPAWPSIFSREAGRIRAALGDRVRLLEHVGSTSVPGLAAKPVIDVLLAVLNSADEAAYMPDLQAAGFVLRVREPDWHEHRLFKSPRGDINLHVFSASSHEIARMIGFRDHLRRNDADRLLYEATKRALAAQTWAHVQDYADAKTSIIETIIERAEPACAG